MNPLSALAVGNFTTLYFPSTAKKLSMEARQQLLTALQDSPNYGSLPSVKSITNATGFDPSKFVKQIGSIFSPSMLVSKATKLADVFAPSLSKSFYQKLFDMTYARFNLSRAEAPGLYNGSMTTFTASTLLTYSKRV